MPVVRLILALHNHQPVGNFDGVFEGAYRDSYLPFLEVLEGYPEIPFVLHTSGPLVEWLVEHRPEYIERVRALVEAGRVEILGGGFYEPILTMIPHRDRVGQIREFAAYLREVFGAQVRGMWVPERVWEQHLVSALAEAGVEYTVLDDFHFQRAGLIESDLLGYYFTEDEGRLLKIFPGSERLRYLMPFQEPHATYEYLRRLAHEQPGATVVFADDGEKFGSWPETFDHVYTHGWLRRFCDMLIGNRDWIQPTTLARAVDATLPLGKIYLPDCSYREMTEWALPAPRLAEYLDAVRETAGQPAAERLKPFVRAGGSWRNFKARYAESDEMYARMLGLSQRLADAQADGRSDPDYLDVARQELYRAQCNCPYWHGAFGGLYLPHLRNAIYRHLIAAENALDDAAGRAGPRVAIEVGDFNLDARQEVRIENDRLVALVRPATGGHIYELDVREPLDQPAGHARAPPRGVSPVDRGGSATAGPGLPRPGERPEQSDPQTGGARPAPRLRQVAAQGARRSLLPGQRDARRPPRLSRRRARRFRHGRLPVEVQPRIEAGRAHDGTPRVGRRSFDPCPQVDRSRGRLEDARDPVRARGNPPGHGAPFRRRDQPGGAGRACAPIAITPTTPVPGSGCSTRRSIFPRPMG